MKEIGGYIELDQGYETPLHPAALALNCGRNCLAYLIEARHIGCIWLPDLLCDSVFCVCQKFGVDVKLYMIGTGFEPVWDFDVADDEYLYLVDYYGQLMQSCVAYAYEYCGGRLVVDEAQALFKDPWKGIDTLYTPRKFLGVSDGGFLYTDVRVKRSPERDESCEHMGFLLGRVEKGATAFYKESKNNNARFSDEPIKKMSALTARIMGSLDYAEIQRRREDNWDVLATALDRHNELTLCKPSAPFMYPLLIKDGHTYRENLAAKGIYIPTLWPDVFAKSAAGGIAYRYAQDILPLPVDQRYGPAEMENIVQALREEGAIPKELSGKKIAILGGTRISCEIVRAAKDLGMHTTVIDYYPPEKSPAKQIADDHALISVADTDCVAAYLKKNRIDGVITGYTDSILGFYADICKKADLPCYGTGKQFEVFTDKKTWKHLCRRYGVPTAQEYDEDIVELSTNKIPLPLFVKPSDSSGARGVAVVKSAQDLPQAIAAARTCSKNGKVVLEDYLEGPEVTVFWLFIDGTYRVFLLGNRLVKHNQDGVIPLPAGYTFPASVATRYMQEVVPRAQKMFSSLGIKNGMMFMQCSVVDGLPYVYDIGYRLTGSLEHHLTKAAAGYSPMDMLLRFAVTGAMTEDPCIWRKIDMGMQSYCYNISCLMSPGTIDHFEGLDEVRKDPSVVSIFKSHLEGETLPPEAKGELRQIALRILGCVDELRDLEDTMFRIQSKMRIVSPEGKDLMLPGLEQCDFDNNVKVIKNVRKGGGQL